MINRIISFSIRNKFIIGLFVLSLIGLGIWSLSTVKLGSVPDITNNQVQVITVSPNLSTEDIEQFVTYPVELSMGNLPGVKEIRSISRFGLSVVTIVFRDDMGIYLPRQLVQEKLNEVSERIPEEFGRPSMGPITTGLGEIYQYTLEPEPGYDSAFSITELRSIQDWIVKRQMTLLDGVVEVNSFGGKIKQYEVAINPEKLNAMNVSISEVFDALKKNNVNTGGAYIEKNKMANFIRGEGLIRSLDDIRNISIRNENGIPILIDDVAEKVHYGSQVRYGAFTRDGEEAVGGMVLMLKGSNPDKVVENVKERIAKIQQSLPEGLKIEPFLDRSALISRTTDTVKRNLTEGALIVIFALVILLGSLRGGLITASTIPLSLLFAFILMKQFDIWANLMSLGAIDFGIIVDGAVIIIEGTVFQVQQRLKSGQHKFDQKAMDRVAYDSGSTMMNSAFFGQIIILIVFTPILFLTGVEGKMFQPMAYTFGFAMIGAIILCLTYVPMMSALFMKPSKNKNNWFSRLENKLEKLSGKIIHITEKSYYPVLKGALRQKGIALLAAIVLLIITIFTFTRMGGEFVPKLDEGDIAMQALIRPGSGLDESIRVSEEIENILLNEYPEVKKVLARIGVADIPTDPMPMDIADIFIILEKDTDQWESAETKAELIEKIKQSLSVLPGVNFVFSQPVDLRFNELLTGVREDVAVKLFGEDLDVLTEKVEEMAEIIRTVPGVGDVNPERTSGLPQMTVVYNRKKVAQYGLDIEKLNRYVASAFAGGKAGIIFEGEKRFDLVIRFDEKHRQSIEDVRSLYIDLDDQTQVPIKEVADIQYRPGPMQISRENTYRTTYVGVNARGRDVESVVEDIRQKMNEQLELPPGYYITYGGEFENLKRAQERLSIVVPIALFLIFVMLYFALNSFSQSLMIYIAIPLAAIGGVFALWIRDMPFSISAGIGFIVLFGVAVLNGLVLISRFNSLKEEGVMNTQRRIISGTRERIRPIMLTATTDIFGFLPMAFSTSAGAEVQRPLATVVIGGMLTSTLLTLIIIPVLYSLVEKRKQLKRPKLKNKLPMLFPLFLLFLTPQLSGQDTTQTVREINVEKAINKAINNHPAIKAFRLNLDQKKALRPLSWYPGPTQIYTGTEEAGNNQEGIVTPWGIQQELDILGMFSEAKRRKHEMDVAKEKLSLQKQKIRKAVGQAWSETLKYKEQMIIYVTMDSVFKELKKAAEINYKTEAISRLEYLALVNQANQFNLRSKQLRHDYLSARAQLNKWFKADTIFDVDQAHAALPDKSVFMQSSFVNNHPELNLSQAKVNLANARLKEERAGLLPKIYGQYGQQEIAGEDGFYSYQVGIQMPLFFWGQTSKIKAAKIDQEIAKANRSRQNLEIKSRFADQKEQYLKWSESWTYYQEEALPLAKEQQKGAITSFREGAIDYMQFIQNVRDALQIKVNAWDAYGKYLEYYWQLNYYNYDDQSK